MTFTLLCVTLAILLELTLLLTAGAEVFSSMATLRALLDNQDALLDGVEKYIVKEEERLAQLRSLIKKKRQDISGFTHDSPIHHAQHPTTAYILVRDWSFISDKVYDTSSADHLKVPPEPGSASLPAMPDYMDRAGAQRAIIRLQRVYNLSLDDLALGKVRGHPSHMALDGRDFYDIGLAAYYMSYYSTAIMWLEKAMSHYPSVDLDKRNALYWLAHSYSMTQEMSKAIMSFKIASEIDPSNETLISQFKNINYSATLDDEQSSNYTYIEYYPSWKIGYEAQCRQQVVSRRNDMWCEYQTHGIQYSRYKVEVLNQDPWVIIYHNITWDSEVEIIKNMSTPHLKRASVGDPAKTYVTDERIGKVAWLWDQLGNPFIQELSMRVEQATGLVTNYYHQYSNSEPFQVVNYGLGGQYEPHLDTYENKEYLSNLPQFLMGTGDRIATFMLYLSDVAEGGGTVFPLIDVYIPAIKNSAAFWYNIHRNGTTDLRTQHAGCPVLVGEKWVANKWMREFGQVFRRPCGPTPTATELESRNAAAGL